MNHIPYGPGSVSCPGSSPYGLFSESFRDRGPKTARLFQLIFEPITSPCSLHGLANPLTMQYSVSIFILMQIWMEYSILLLMLSILKVWRIQPVHCTLVASDSSSFHLFIHSWIWKCSDNMGDILRSKQQRYFIFRTLSLPAERTKRYIFWGVALETEKPDLWRLGNRRHFQVCFEILSLAIRAYNLRD